jgi:hypothetical protein
LPPQRIMAGKELLPTPLPPTLCSLSWRLRKF